MPGKTETPTEVRYADAESLVGRELGVSRWHTVTQAEIDAFADATNQRHWFHSDPERARRESPFGTTIAPGNYLFCLILPLSKEVWKITGCPILLNYGIDRLRFLSPVPEGARLRARIALAEVRDVPRGKELRADVTLELEGAERPALVAQTLVRCYPEAPRPA